ncbi:hypothetical protein SeMB42_g05076 [Synchytrium endobioticum]|uniref:B box-type domain-containing protein n=1 Tax=Synchytrium endobioticum TaxID=286115 RepID=A0A507CTS8_9FUNG|nr:hypothetical protein SeMB42_g05076 [Synchytrium endobioticum]
MMLSEKTSQRTTLNPSSLEFAYLEYFLQLSLHASTARIQQAYSISNPHLTAQFDRRCKDILSLQSWVDCSTLSGANAEDEVLRHGFHVGGPNASANAGINAPALTSGMRFTVGCVPRASDKGHGGKHRRMLLCRIGVGRSYVADEGRAEKDAVPDGYDSFYLEDKKGSADDSRHEYYIKSSAQILPQYLVHFDYDPTLEKKSLERIKCANCEQVDATVYCASDAASLCNACDTLLHNSKVLARHIRTPIRKGTTESFGTCRHHADKPIEYFCSQCHIPVCVTCKMVGNHANGEAARHKLVSVAEAYATVMHESNERDPLLQNRRSDIQNQLVAVAAREKAVDKMGQQMELQIDEIHRKALADSRSIVKKKLDVLRGDTLELKRQLQEIERLEAFLKYQQAGDPTQFLFSWARHQQVRAELHDFRFFKDDIDVQLDMKVTGGISVIVDPTIAAVATHASANPVPLKKMGSKIHAPSSSTSHLGNGAASTNPAMGYPRASKVQERRTQRRTSDFFSETLGVLDGMTVRDDDGASYMAYDEH